MLGNGETQIGMQSPDGMNNVELLCNNSIAGIWLSRTGQVGGQVSLQIDDDKACFMVWPLEGYFEEGKQEFPFAIHAGGIQVPLPNGRIVAASLSQIGEMLAAFGATVYGEKIEDASEEQSKNDAS